MHREHDHRIGGKRLQREGRWRLRPEAHQRYLRFVHRADPSCPVTSRSPTSKTHTHTHTYMHIQTDLNVYGAPVKPAWRSLVSELLRNHTRLRKRIYAPDTSCFVEDRNAVRKPDKATESTSTCKAARRRHLHSGLPAGRSAPYPTTDSRWSYLYDSWQRGNAYNVGQALAIDELQSMQVPEAEGPVTGVVDLGTYVGRRTSGSRGSCALRVTTEVFF